MAFLTETYNLTTDDEAESLEIQKDFLGNIRLVLTESGESKTMLISEEFATQFTYVLNRIS